MFKIDIANATDIAGMDGNAVATVAVPKTLFLDIAWRWEPTAATSKLVLAVIEGTAFGPDVNSNGKKTHTLWVLNDNDFPYRDRAWWSCRIESEPVFRV